MSNFGGKENLSNLIMKDSIERIPVNSSTIDAIAYDADEQILLIQFKNGTEYEYLNVPPMEFDGFRYAPSLGSYLSRNIKGTYPYRKAG